MRENKEDSLNNGYFDRIIGLNHRQGLSGAPVKLPCGAFQLTGKVLSGQGKGRLQETFQVFV
jgi:hypothetical protein